MKVYTTQQLNKKIINVKYISIDVNENIESNNFDAVNQFGNNNIGVKDTICKAEYTIEKKYCLLF